MLYGISFVLEDVKVIQHQLLLPLDFFSHLVKRNVETLLRLVSWWRGKGSGMSILNVWRNLLVLLRSRAPPHRFVVSI